MGAGEPEAVQVKLMSVCSLVMNRSKSPGEVTMGASVSIKMKDQIKSIEYNVSVHDNMPHDIDLNPKFSILLSKLFDKLLLKNLIH